MTKIGKVLSIGVVFIMATMIGYNTVDSPKTKGSKSLTGFYTTNNVVSETTEDTKINYSEVSITRTKSVVPKVKSVKKLELNIDRTIEIFGKVGGNALMAAALVAEMNIEDSQSPIYIILNSPGGSVIDGAALVSAMQASTAPVYTICYTFCASMAAVILQYGDVRYASDRSLVMFHPASFRASGDVDRVRSYTESIYKFILKIDADIAKRIGWTLEDYKRRIINELWLDSDEAIQSNVIDQIVYISPLDQESYTNKYNTNNYKRDFNDLMWIYEGSKHE